MPGSIILLLQPIEANPSHQPDARGGLQWTAVLAGSWSTHWLVGQPKELETAPQRPHNGECSGRRRENSAGIRPQISATTPGGPGWREMSPGTPFVSHSHSGSIPHASRARRYGSDGRSETPPRGPPCRPLLTAWLMKLETTRGRSRQLGCVRGLRRSTRHPCACQTDDGQPLGSFYRPVIAVLHHMCDLPVE
jgi:hypothetical protein